MVDGVHGMMADVGRSALGEVTHIRDTVRTLEVAGQAVKW